MTRYEPPQLGSISQPASTWCSGLGTGAVLVTHRPSGSMLHPILAQTFVRRIEMRPRRFSPREGMTAADRAFEVGCLAAPAQEAGTMAVRSKRRKTLRRREGERMNDSLGERSTAATMAARAAHRKIPPFDHNLCASEGGF